MNVPNLIHVPVSTDKNVALPDMSGVYVLFLKTRPDSTLYIELGRSNYGLFWEQMYETAIRNYGEENLSYEYHNAVTPDNY